MVRTLENEILCRLTEQAVGRVMHTPKDFDYLRECIYERLHVMVSATTLKRIWGYLNEEVQPRTGTLSILAQFIGYADYESFCCSDLEEVQSSPVMSRKINVAEELRPGDGLCLFWQPGRVCQLRYEGNLRFRVLESVNTRIQAGDTFSCSLIIEGEPLYIDNLHQKDRPATAYVCGKKNGVLFSFVRD